MAVLSPRNPCTDTGGRRPSTAVLRLSLAVLLGIGLSGCSTAAIPPPDASESTGRTTTSPDVSTSPPAGSFSRPRPTDMDPDEGEGAGAPPYPSATTRTTAPPRVEPEPTTGSPSPLPTLTSAAPDLAAFLADCERGVREWRAAQVDYPAEFEIQVGEEDTYVAAVDARDTPVPPGEAIPGPSPTGDAAAVRCEVAARLSPSGDGLTVDETGWVLRRFTPTGFIRWSWTVTATKGGDQELELELQPAIRTDDGRIEVGNSTLDVSTFITRAHVQEDAIQQAGSWMDSHKGPLAVIAAALAAAAIGLVRFSREFATEMRQTVAAWSGTPPDAGRATSSGSDEDLASSPADNQA